MPVARFDIHIMMLLVVTSAGVLVLVLLVVGDWCWSVGGISMLGCILLLSVRLHTGTEDKTHAGEQRISGLGWHRRKDPK